MYLKEVYYLYEDTLSKIMYRCVFTLPIQRINKDVSVTE